MSFSAGGRERAGQYGATKLEMVVGNRYKVRWHGEFVSHQGVFVCAKRWFYIFRSDDGFSIVCRPESVVIQE